MAPWAAAAGLLRGDQPVAYGGVSLTGNVDSDNNIWAQMSPREYVDIRVKRAGNEISLRLPCRDDSEAWQARVALLQSIAEGRWQACIDAISRTATTAGYFSSGMQYTALLCMREKAIAEKQRRLPDEYWPTLHAWATKAIEESHYNPNGLAEVRPRLLSATEALEKAARQTLADDIKEQISAFRQIAPVATAPGESSKPRRIGTAFVVRPDGFLLTAFHVVRNAKAIEIFCPESGRASARVDRFSEAYDLAILKVAEGTKTPTYLSLADPESFSLGERVFAIGYPARKILGGEAKVTEGVISSLSVGGNAGYMQISVPVKPGDSGGPLIASSGDVVGVTIATASGLSFLGETGTSPLSVSWAANGAFAVALFDSPPPSPRITDRNALIRSALKATCSVRASSEVE
jgi:S1-C subfamily serine protease